MKVSFILGIHLIYKTGLCNHTMVKLIYMVDDSHLIVNSIFK
jgi:hypothetical protein